MKSAKTILIVAAVLFAALSLRPVSAEREPETTEPARVVRTPARPPSPSEEEAPIPKPPTPIPNQAARPVRVTSPRTPGRTTPTRIPVRVAPTRPATRPGATRPTPTRRVRPPEDPHKNSIIQLEAFMVQVRLSSLHSLGVPQISEGCKSISAEHILKLLKTTDAAVVTAGAKVAVGQKSKAEIKSTTRRSILLGPTEKKRTEYVDVGTQFTAVAEVRRDDKIFVELEFEHSVIEEGDDKAYKGELVGRDFSSGVTLQDGKPTLVGGMQEKEDAVFLIVTAHIKD